MRTGLSIVSRGLRFILPTITLIACFCACVPGRQTESASIREWADIVQTDTLVVGTITSPSAFYVYRGEDMGYEYRKVEEFARHHALKTRIHITNSLDTLKSWVAAGQIDVCITSTPITRENVEIFTFCAQIDTAALVLAQRVKSDPIRSALELKGRSVHVVRSGVEELRLKQMALEMGGEEEINIVPVDTLGVEDLLDSVSRDSNFLVIADERIAKVYASFNRNIDVKTRVSVPIRYGWIVNRRNQELADSLTSFFTTHYTPEASLRDTYSILYRRHRRSPSLPSPHSGTISPYDDLFRKEAERLGWSWTVLASIAFKESRFRPEVVAWTGAMGLMGIMPATGSAFGASRDELLLPEVSVRVAVDCLINFGKAFKDIKNDQERYLFTLASYNAGVGHIQDACRLAQKYGYDPQVWEGAVQKFVLLKSNAKYYNDPVCKYGYLRGKETVKYVEDITVRSERYASLLNGNSLPETAR